MLLRLSFLIVPLVLLLGGTASASCAQKSAMFTTITERLVDFSNSQDINQKSRDEEIIRKTTDSVADQDCLNQSAEMERLTDLAVTVHLHLQALADFDGSTNLLTSPIEKQISWSLSKGASVPCRCYARRSALNDILGDDLQLVLTYLEPQKKFTITPRERRFILAWYAILNDDLVDASGIHFKSRDTLSNVDYRDTYRLVNAQLKKHCGVTLADTPPFPDGCEFVK